MTQLQTKLQMRRATVLVEKAMMTDKAHSSKRHLLLMALQSGTGGFEKVTGMVDGMVGVLEGEQQKDDKTDVWCLAEIDQAKADIKATEGKLEDVRSGVDQAR